jgi:hypothetical protein
MHERLVTLVSYCAARRQQEREKPHKRCHDFLAFLVTKSTAIAVCLSIHVPLRHRRCV